VIVAGLSNLLVALAKIVGGVISRSAAMQAEAAHSVADTVTEVLLYQANRRGGRAPDERHPFGHGRETFFWAFLAALATFTAGALFSFVRGIDTLVNGESGNVGSLFVSYGVLVFAAFAEGGSLLRANRQLRAMADHAGLPPRQYLRITSDTPLKAVVFEDRAALAGLGLAGAGFTLWQVTGHAEWDGAASIAIGVVLAVIAVSLTRTNLSLLVGQRVTPQLHAALQAEVESLDGVEAVQLFIVVVLGPGELLVAAKISFADNSSTADIERVADDAEKRLRARFPGVRYVFLDPTA
jgi:cation diffusion facilitator family transporter